MPRGSAAEEHARRARSGLKEVPYPGTPSALLGFARGERVSGCQRSAVALGFARGGRSSGGPAYVDFGRGEGAPVWRSPEVGFGRGGHAGGSGAEDPVAEQFVQLLVNGLITGSILALTGVGASLVFGIQRIANFAHGEYLTIGAYVALVLNVALRQNLVVSAIGGMLGTALFALIAHFGLFRPLRGRGTIAISLITVGLALVIRDGIFLIAGSQVRVYAVSQTDVVTLGFVRLSPGQTVAVAVALVVAPLTALFLAKTRLGKSMRAVADNRSLAAVAGIDVERIAVYVWVLAGGLAGLGGVMLALVQGPFDPNLGVGPLFLIFTTVVLGGIGSAFGALTAGLALGLAMELSTWSGLIGGIEPKYKPILAFLVLILLLLYRPQGLFGRARVL